MIAALQDNPFQRESFVLIEIMDEHTQQELFPDEMDKPRIFRCVAGAFIGRFNRYAGPHDASTIRMSVFMSSVAAAEAALEAGVWPAAETEEESVILSRGQRTSGHHR